MRQDREQSSALRVLREDGLSGPLGRHGPPGEPHPGLLRPGGDRGHPAGKTSLALFDDAYDPDPDELLLPTAVRAHHDPSGDQLPRPLQHPRARRPGRSRRCLRTFLREVEDRFDVVLIDCPPNLHLCSWNALLAADFVMVPLQAEDFGAQGITHIQRAIDLAFEKYNPKLRMLGYLVTLRQRLALHDVYEQRLRNLYGPMVFDSVFPSRKDFKEAIAERSPIHFLRPRSAAANEVKAIAEEILRRVPEAQRRPPEFLQLEDRVVDGKSYGGWHHEPSRAARPTARGQHEREPRRPGPVANDPAPAPSPMAGESPEDGRTRDRQAGHMEIDRIIPDPDQPRKFFSEESLEQLAQSLKTTGQLQPIRVRWSKQHAKWVIISGERRYRAAFLAGFKTIACQFVDQALTESEIRQESLIENLLREDLRPIEAANGYRQLMELNGWTIQQVADALNISKGTVSKALALLKLPEDIQAQVEEGQIAPTAAYEVSRVEGEGAQRELARRVVDEGLKRDDAGQLAGKARRGRGGRGEALDDEGLRGRRRPGHRHVGQGVGRPRGHHRGLGRGDRAGEGEGGLGAAMLNRVGTLPTGCREAGFTADFHERKRH